jgi:hypothetical protein
VVFVLNSGSFTQSRQGRKEMSGVSMSLTPSPIQLFACFAAFAWRFLEEFQGAPDERKKFTPRRQGRKELNA